MWRTSYAGPVARMTLLTRSAGLFVACLFLAAALSPAADARHPCVYEGPQSAVLCNLQQSVHVYGADPDLPRVAEEAIGYALCLLDPRTVCMNPFIDDAQFLAGLLLGYAFCMAQEPWLCDASLFHPLLDYVLSLL